MTSQTGKWTMTNMLPDVSKVKGNQIIKFSQLIAYNARKEVGGLVPDLFFFKKCFIWNKSKLLAP